MTPQPTPAFDLLVQPPPQQRCYHDRDLNSQEHGGQQKEGPSLPVGDYEYESISLGEVKLRGNTRELVAMNPHCVWDIADAQAVLPASPTQISVLVKGEIALFKPFEKIPRVSPQHQERSHCSSNIARACCVRSWLAKAACPTESEEVYLVACSVQPARVIGKADASRGNADGSISQRTKESSKRFWFYDQVAIDKGQMAAARY
jgi:hypothetical protein